MRTLTIFSRPGCHLCDEMKQVVDRVLWTRAIGAPAPFHVEEVDISGDERLEHAYGLEIPVLAVDGLKVAKFRITEDQLRRILRERQSV